MNSKMSDFTCFLCEKKIKNVKDIVKHLQILHNIKDKTVELKCCANSKCTQSFKTFRCFKEHISRCQMTSSESNEVYIVIQPFFRIF